MSIAELAWEGEYLGGVFVATFHQVKLSWVSLNFNHWIHTHLIWWLCGSGRTKQWRSASDMNKNKHLE